MQVSRHGIIAIAAPIAAIAVMTFWLTGYGSQAIDEILPQRLPEVTIEQVTFEDSMILLNVRNTGLLEVEIAMADVNDRIQPAAVEPDGKLGRFESAIIRIPFEWNEAEPYSVGVTTDDGTRFVREIESAAQVPERGIKLVGTLAILGVYVGIIPVMVGLLWSPFIRRAGFERYAFFLSLTVGMLFFIGIDSIFAASEVAAENLSDSFDGCLWQPYPYQLDSNGTSYRAGGNCLSHQTRPCLQRIFGLALQCLSVLGDADSKTALYLQHIDYFLYQSLYQIR